MKSNPVPVAPLPVPLEPASGRLPYDPLRPAGLVSKTLEGWAGARDGDRDEKADKLYEGCCWPYWLGCDGCCWPYWLGCDGCCWPYILGCEGATTAAGKEAYDGGAAVLALKVDKLNDAGVEGCRRDKAGAGAAEGNRGCVGWFNCWATGAGGWVGPAVRPSSDSNGSKVALADGSSHKSAPLEFLSL